MDPTKRGLFYRINLYYAYLNDRIIISYYNYEIIEYTI